MPTRSSNSSKRSSSAFATDAVEGQLDAALIRKRLLSRMFEEHEPCPTINRFELISELGRGGMGRVYLAHDPELDRKVALKLVGSGRAGELATRRMVREAQALARLAHPNVVTVFEVGRTDTGVWIAMEYVRGLTMLDWVRQHAPSAAAIVRQFIAAGRGLAAAHAAALIHRDIKPTNILVGDDGRVRLIDFGLVRATAGETHEDPDADPPTTTATSTTRGFQGTPAYAAPEQHAGVGVGPLADQYSFCVSLWEALTGARPPGARSSSSSWPSAKQVGLTKAIHAALSRGLAEDPRRRFATFDELLAALELSPRRSGAWSITAAALASGLLGLGALGLLTPTPDSKPDACNAAEVALRSIWTSERRVVLEARAPWLSPALELWTGRWSAAARRSCEATRDPGIEDEATQARHWLCFAEQLDEFAVAIKAIEAWDPDRRRSRWPAAGFAELLGDPEACLTRGRDEGPPTPPERLSEAVAEARELLFSARLAAELGELDRARVALERVRNHAGHAWAPLSAELALSEGRVERLGGSARPARVALERALSLSDQLALPWLRADAWSELASLALTLELDTKAAALAIRREQDTLDSLAASPLRHARARVRRANLAQVSGEWLRAEADLRAVIDEAEQLGVGPWERAGWLRNLGVVLAQLGRASEAADALTRARAHERSGVRVNDDPGTRTGDESLYEGIAATDAGRLDEAAALFEGAQAAYEAAQGPISVEVARTRIALADLAIRQGHLELARREAELADRMIVRVLGPGSRLRADALSALGTVAYAQSRPLDAVEVFGRSLTIYEASAEPDELVIGVGHSNLAEALVAAGKLDEAEPQLREALRIFDLWLPSDHIYRAFPDKTLGRLHAERGEAAEARSHLRRALSRYGETLSNPPEQAELHMLLAHAEAACGDRRRAEAERAAAEALYVKLDDRIQADAAASWSPRAVPARACPPIPNHSPKPSLP